MGMTSTRFPLIQKNRQSRLATDEETVSLRDQILSDAEYFATQRIEETGQQIETMFADAKAQIENWWQERREQDEQQLMQIRDDGFKLGFDEGKEQAEFEVHSQWESMLTEAKSILDSAYETKEQIILRSRAFPSRAKCSNCRENH